jgi:hypothetical protein
VTWAFSRFGNRSGSAVHWFKGDIMFSGMSNFTLVHVAISLVAIGSGFVVLFGLLVAKGLDGWTALFLATTWEHSQQFGSATGRSVRTDWERALSQCESRGDKGAGSRLIEIGVSRYSQLRFLCLGLESF